MMIRVLRSTLTFPLRLLGHGQASASYEKLSCTTPSPPTSPIFADSEATNTHRLRQSCRRRRRCSISRLLAWLALIVVVLLLVGSSGYRYRHEVIAISNFRSWGDYTRWKSRLGQQHRYHQDAPWNEELSGQSVDHDDDVPLAWQTFPRLNGYYNGLRTLVDAFEHVPEQSLNNSELLVPVDIPESIPLEAIKFDPYNHVSHGLGSSLFDSMKRSTCFLDDRQSLPAPDVYVYSGIPQHMTDPFFGSYEDLNLDGSICYDRFGRLGPYGYGYSSNEGGLGIGEDTEKQGIESERAETRKINWNDIDWFQVQTNCVLKNQHRFRRVLDGGISRDQAQTQRIARNVFILRSYTGFEWDEYMTVTVRALITELNVQSGGEFDVHILIQVRDNSLPIWADKKLYKQIVCESVPREFWGISSLWSEQQMSTIYPDPFPYNLQNPSNFPLHSRYRSGHFALQWFSQQHPEYEFLWNWELDSRYTGHYYEFLDRIARWAQDQPRKGLWERNAQYYIPPFHGNWTAFVRRIEKEIAAGREPPIWGPLEFPGGERSASAHLDEGSLTPPHSYAEDNYEWGVGEAADLITFNPIFDVEKTNWVFRDDVTGYDPTLPPPPRRAAIITMARLSRRLLNLMHVETWTMKHTMVQEMWPAACALHHGLKAVYVPHPVFFDRNWPLEHMDQVFNHPASAEASPFGWAEHLHLGSSFYYNSHFSAALWRRWLGHRENDEGGADEETQGTGRMCLRAQLFHPIKQETPVGGGSER